MDKIWYFFENMDDLVYVTDVDTDELVYMNKRILEIYGYHSLEQVKGRKCYEVLQKSGSPCSICNNCRLREGYFEEWQYYNPIFRKKFALRDTLIVEKDTGRKYRMEMAIDLGYGAEQVRKLKDYQDLETVVNEGLRVALKKNTPNESIEVFLEYMGKALRGERTYIFEKNASGGDDNTYEWVKSGVTAEKDNLQNLPAEVCANWYRRFEEGKIIVIEDLEDIRENDRLQYDNLKRQNIHSLVVVPLYDDGKVIAFYGVDNPPAELLSYTSNILQTMGYFLVSCIKRRNLMRLLEDMSYKDALTGLGNRFAVEAYIRQIKPEEKMGVVYCDITGLKHVNDTMGHKEGDRLITRAAECLLHVFGDYGVFRIGGDELLVLCAGIADDELKEKVEFLRKNTAEQSVVLAIGVVWQDNARKSLDTLLQESEKKMYEEKAEYYRTSGILKRQ